jgi:hypothetical protein
VHKSQVIWVTEFCVVAPAICGSSVWNWLDVTLMTLEVSDGSWIFGKFVHPCIRLDLNIKNILEYVLTFIIHWTVCWSQICSSDCPSLRSVGRCVFTW